MAVYTNSANLNIGYYEKRYSSEDEPFEDIEILDVIRAAEQQNVGFLSSIQMEIYPVGNSYFYINGKRMRTFDGKYISPSDLDIYSLVIHPNHGTTFGILYYYYL